VVFTYSFLVLSVLLAIPGLLVWILRRDLRRVIIPMGIASVPFAFTERMFYPDYWEPRFLFDLVNVIGFGIEDILFVVGLAAFTSTAWAFVTGKRYAPLDMEVSKSRPNPLSAALALLGVCFAMVAVLWFVGLPMIYGAPIIMTVMGLGMCYVRRDLFIPSIGGAAITTVVYTGLCIVLAALIPDVFALDWKTDQFLNMFVLGVPVEEILYASTAGFVATVFYPFVARQRFVTP
jgi:hypothetical protein